jgi:hypothetical protein
MSQNRPEQMGWLTTKREAYAELFCAVADVNRRGMSLKLIGVTLDAAWDSLRADPRFASYRNLIPIIRTLRAIALSISDKDLGDRFSKLHTGNIIHLVMNACPDS